MTAGHNRFVEFSRTLAAAWAGALESAQAGLQTHTSPEWLQRLDAWASDVVGVLFAWVRIVSAIAALMWSFFLVVLPLLLATLLIVWIVATAMPHGLPASR